MLYLHLLAVFVILLAHSLPRVDAFLLRSTAQEFNQLYSSSILPNPDIDPEVLPGSEAFDQRFHNNGVGKSISSLQRRDRPRITVTWAPGVLEQIRKPFTEHMHEKAVQDALRYENRHNPPLGLNRLPTIWKSAVIQKPFHRTPKRAKPRKDSASLDHHMHILVTGKTLCGFVKQLRIHPNRRVYDSRPDRQYFPPPGPSIVPWLDFNPLETIKSPPRSLLHDKLLHLSPKSTPFDALLSSSLKASHPSSSGGKSSYKTSMPQLPKPSKALLSSLVKEVVPLSQPSIKALLPPQRPNLSHEPIHPPYLPRQPLMSPIHKDYPPGHIPSIMLDIKQGQLGLNSYVLDPNFPSGPSRPRNPAPTGTWIRGPYKTLGKRL
ncbi:hypothetical protein MMC10_008213 [Thelotrema lepadinum]|nr:hypothetical protein [Thelotrema lepadinum]